MYLMNPDLAFGLERMRDRLRRAEMLRLARQTREPTDPAPPVGLTLVGAPLECRACDETVAA